MVDGKIKITDNFPYVLGEIYPTTFHMLRPDYLDMHSVFAPIRKIATNRVKIDFQKMSKTLTETQKQLYYDLVGFDRKQIVDLYSGSSNPKFALTGTTTWVAPGNPDRDFFANKQINMIKNLIDPTGDLYKYLNGKTYDFFFKLHPRGGDINEKITAAFPNYLRIPDSVGYEVLIVAGLLPEKTGGVISSLYYSIPSDNISFLVYVGDKDELNTSRMQVMLELGIMKNDQLYFWGDLKNMP